MPLTKEQQRLLGEIRSIVDALGLDFDTILRYPPSEERTVYLERIRTHLIRGAVMGEFILVDYLLTDELAIETFGGHGAEPGKKNALKRFEGELQESRVTLRQKLELYDTFRPVPADIREAILGLSAVRNAFAHNFILDEEPRPAKYRGRKILQLSVFEKFLEDQKRVKSFILRTKL
jgi:hypothetical protein